MKKIYISILLAITVLNVNAQIGPPWVKTTVGFNYIFRSIDFPGNQNDIGYMGGESLTYSGDGIVIKTTDGGNTWNSIWTGVDMGVEGACFVDVNTGYIAGWPNLAQGWNGVGKTTDGGITWTPLTVINNLYYFNDIVFKDANNGMVMGMTNTIGGLWFTSNGGGSWTAATGITGVPQHACHVTGNTYFMVDNAGSIKKSTNNGANWTTVYSAGAMLLGIDCLDENTIFACGDYGVLVESFDGGVTWTIDQIGTDLWHDFGWESGEVVFGCGTPETVIGSDDGGSTWINAFPGSSYNAALYECTFKNDGAGFICGSQGVLLKRAPSCNAAFTGVPQSLCTGGSVTFTSQSTGSNLTYNWTFEGGSPASSTSSSPVVTYAIAGTYDVKLIVSNGSWSDTLVKTDYITVTDKPAAPVISAAGYYLSSDIANGNQWYRDGIAIAGANQQNYTAVASGSYTDIVTVNACSSDTSNSIYIIIEGETEPQITPVAVITNSSERSFNVIIKDGSEWDINIYDMTGNRIRSGKVKGTTRFETGSEGIFLIELNRGDSRIIRKISI